MADGAGAAVVCSPAFAARIGAHAAARAVPIRGMALVTPPFHPEETLGGGEGSYPSGCMDLCGYSMAQEAAGKAMGEAGIVASQVRQPQHPNRAL